MESSLTENCSEINERSLSNTKTLTSAGANAFYALFVIPNIKA